MSGMLYASIAVLIMVWWLVLKDIGLDDEDENDS
jgi:hypothetical protein